jgi:hypothetical protein
MTSIPRLQRAAATLAVVAGAGLFGLALGGVASVDRELRAATPSPIPDTRQVSDRVEHLPPPEGCERRSDRRPTAAQAL